MMKYSSVKVALVGARGRMGQKAVKALAEDPNFNLVVAVVRSDTRTKLPYSPKTPIFTDLSEALDYRRAHVILDLSNASTTRGVMEVSLGRHIPVVSGVTGVAERDLKLIAMLSRDAQTPAMVVPNFAIGAVLMMRFAELAAKWIPDAEIIEMHHEKKIDAPSGTAVLTAKRIAAGRQEDPITPPTELMKVEGARGGTVEGVPIHSVRLPGLQAHQEVIFGSAGEILTLRHDATDRSVYMPGIKLCLQRVFKLKGLTIGMDSLLV